MIQAREIVNVDGLTKTYGSGVVAVSALRQVSLRVNQGEMVAIMGPSGSGKSTLLHLIGGLDRPTSGSIHIDGQSTIDMNDRALSEVRRRRIGFVFQNYNLLPALTALENVAMPLILDGVRRPTAFERAAAALTAVGLANRSDHRPAELSGGQQQRVSIARALVIQPALILADEPTGALDSETGQEVIRLLRQLVTRQLQTVILVTHDARVAAHADRIVNLKDGAVVDDTRLNTRTTVQGAAQGVASPA
ncbi:MAG: ABC transporter ATP-binding protein [Chloroflexi bacterium]|nr:ABC transporter ATP-binding protein [Chloroflexota bacterium]